MRMNLLKFYLSRVNEERGASEYEKHWEKSIEESVDCSSIADRSLLSLTLIIAAIDSFAARIYLIYLSLQQSGRINKAE